MKNSDCTLILVLQMGTIKTKQRATMNKSSCTGTVTDNRKNLLSRVFFENCNAFWVAVDDILAIFGEGLISCIMCSIVDFVGVFFSSVGGRICNFDPLSR